MKLVLLCGALALACNSTKNEPTASEQRRSPNASVMPTPLAERSDQLPRPELKVDENTAKLALSTPAGSVNRPLRPAPNPTPFAAHHAPDAEPEAQQIKDTHLLTLNGVWRWPNLETLAVEPEADLMAIDAVNKQAPANIKIDLHSNGLMSWQWVSGGFPLPQGSELRARAANFGHVLVWPEQSRYRVLQPGSLRAVLLERRADATPLVLGSVKQLPNGKRMGYVTQISELSTTYGTLLLEQAQLEEAGTAGQLICRTLSELIAASPASSECTEGRVPLHAALRFADGGHCTFTVTEIEHKTEGVTHFTIPPRESLFQVYGLPEVAAVLVDQATQKKLHSRDRGGPHGPQQGLALHNKSANVVYLVLDRVRVSMLEPMQSAHLNDLRPGRYRAQWHSFLGRKMSEPELIDVPGRTDLKPAKHADAGAAP